MHTPVHTWCTPGAHLVNSDHMVHTQVMNTRCTPNCLKFKLNLCRVIDFSILTKIIYLAALTEQLVKLVNTLCVWEGEEDNVTSTRDQVLRARVTCFYVISTCFCAISTCLFVISTCLSVISTCLSVISTCFCEMSNHHVKVSSVIIPLNLWAMTH